MQVELIVAFPCNNQQFYIVDSDMRLNDTYRMHCYVLKASISNTFVLFTVTHVAQQCTGDISALLIATIFTRTCHSVTFMPNKNDRENKTYVLSQYVFSFRPNISVIIKETRAWDKQGKKICL
jgi:hypothetical protein